MRQRMLELMAGAAVIAVVSLALTSVAGHAQTTTARTKTRTGAAPKTAWGEPDLQGVWVNNSATPLERPAALAGRALLTDEEVTELKARAARIFSDSTSDFAGGDNAFLAVLANPDRYKNPNRSTGTALEMVKRDFDNRTSLVTKPSDGKIPFTQAGQGRQAAAAAVRQRPAPAGPEDLPNDLRCITFGVPRLGGNAAGYNSYHQILQTPGYVVLFGEVIHDARIIPLDGRPHLPSSLRQWHGDSRGRWEGKTLVVDTVNFSPKSYLIGAAENLHLVERFTRVAADTITYEITFDDSTTWTEPWTVVIRLKQSQDQMYEYACHEGNYQTMVGMLAGTRAAEKAATEATRPPK